MPLWPPRPGRWRSTDWAPRSTVIPGSAQRCADAAGCSWRTTGKGIVKRQRVLQPDDWHRHRLPLDRSHTATAIGCRHRLQLRYLDRQPLGRNLAGRAVHTNIRHLTQPTPHRQIRRLAVDDQALLSQPARQRHVKALTQIADEPLHLAFGLRPVRCAQAQPEAAVTSKVKEAGMKAMPAAAVAMPLQHDGAHVVVQHLARYATEGEERVLMRLDQCLDP